MITKTMKKKTEIKKIVQSNEKIYLKDNPAVTGIFPEGYMSEEEFFDGLKERITKFYKENGLL